jgi:methyltransferase-like protein
VSNGRQNEEAACEAAQCQRIAGTTHGTAGLLPVSLGVLLDGNLIPFAVRNPGANVLGIDLSAVQIEDGSRRIEKLQLKNIELRVHDIVSIDESFGQFDYIICHGVYSWVPEHVQEAIFRIFQERLTPNGVGYVGYKTYPGWKAHEIVRDAMLLRAGDRSGAQQRLSYGRGMIDFLNEHARAGTVLSRAVENDHGTIKSADAAYVMHDYLASCNAPCYFREFVKRASSHALAYLADADPRMMFASNFGSQVAGPLQDECGDDQVMVEQYLDFIVDRSFRRSLVVHEARKSEITYAVKDARLRGLHYAATFRFEDEPRMDDSAQRVIAPDGSDLIVDSIALKSAVKALNNAWPFTLGFDALCQAARAESDRSDVEARLLVFVRQIVQAGLGRYRCAPLGHRAANPCLSDAARAYPKHLPQGQSPHTFNAWHEPVVLDTASQFLLPLIDGSRSRAELLVLLQTATKGKTSEVELDRILKSLCA